jgi:hypothetical protein
VQNSGAQNGNERSEWFHTLGIKYQARPPNKIQNPKSKIQNPKSKSQTNSKSPNSNRRLEQLEALKFELLEFGFCLGFGIWILVFQL